MAEIDPTPLAPAPRTHPGTPIYDQLVREHAQAEQALFPPLTLRERLGFKPSAEVRRQRIEHFKRQDEATLNPNMLYDLAHATPALDAFAMSPVTRAARA